MSRKVLAYAILSCYMEYNTYCIVCTYVYIPIHVYLFAYITLQTKHCNNLNFRNTPTYIQTCIQMCSIASPTCKNILYTRLCVLISFVARLF